MRVYVAMCCRRDSAVDELRNSTYNVSHAQNNQPCVLILPAAILQFGGPKNSFNLLL